MKLTDLPKALTNKFLSNIMSHGKTLAAGAGIGAACHSWATGGSIYEAVSAILASLFGLF